MENRTIQEEEYRDFSLRVHTHAGTEAQVVKAQVELTYGCNLHCVHCYTDCYNQPDLIKKERTTGEILQTLDELSGLGVLWVCFTGGEIFMRKDFRKIYDHAKIKGFLITLLTNGTMFTEAIVDHLKESPPFSIEISCHGATEETFDRITQVPGSYKRFLKGIELLRSRGLPLKLKTSAMTLNKHELDNIKDFVEGLGLRFQLSRTIYPRLNGDLEPCHYRLSSDEIVELEFGEGDFDEGNEACSVETGATEGLEAPPDDRLFRCGCGTFAVHINAWGSLGACTWVNEPRANSGQKVGRRGGC
jgi:MoaA/NifB/PqqE/SkfB family radical SAM enzyme